jgi:hypothetical protein
MSLYMSLFVVTSLYVYLCVSLYVSLCVSLYVSHACPRHPYICLCLSFRCMCLHVIMICPHVSSCTPSLFLEKNNKQREVIRGSENDEYIANALLRLSGKLGIFAQPSAFADNQKKKT